MSGTLRRNGILGGPIGQEADSGAPTQASTSAELQSQAAGGNLAEGYYEVQRNDGTRIITYWNGVIFVPPVDGIGKLRLMSDITQAEVSHFLLEFEPEPVIPVSIPGLVVDEEFDPVITP
jgi:hypothetical protein